MRIKEELNKLKDVDVYSLMLFVLYKTINIPEYSTLSELAYILDKESLLKLCEYFGGMTIKIPTISELENLIYSLVLYQYVNVEHMDYDKAIQLIGHSSSELRQVKSNYQTLCKVLENYSFERNSNAKK